MTDNAPGWQPDPTGRHEHRYWDGSQWTENVANGGVSATDPYDVATDATAVTEPPANPYETPVTADPNAPGGWDDPTQVAPTPPADPTDPTAPFATATPPAPPAYTPPSPVSGDGPGDGSKKGLLIGLGVLAAVAIAVIAFLALGGDDDDTDPIASGDATTTTEDEETDDTSEPDDATTTTESDEDPFDDGGDLGELPDDFEEQMADIYESQMGLSRDQAECLADRMGEVVRSGEMAEEDAMGDIMAYLSDCDISVEDLAGN